MTEADKEQEYRKNNKKDLKNVGYNLLVLIIYTALCKTTEEGIIWDMLLVGMHVVVCIIAAIAARKWIWLLSAFVVLLIGFSTCVGILPR